MSLVARHLEDNAISTVILGSARDIVEHCGVPRFLFTDFPLGNPCGKPWDPGMQRDIVELGLTLLEQATEPGTTRQSPYRWSDDDTWKSQYMKVDASNAEELRTMGEQRREAQKWLKRTEQMRSD